MVSPGASAEVILASAKSLAKVTEAIAGKVVVKEIAVPGRMVNIVVKG